MKTARLRYAFASDNTAGVAPEALQAIIAEGSAFSPAYGVDETTKVASDLIRAMLNHDADVYFVASGTAANALSLSALCRPFEAVLAHEHAHIRTDEAGAPGMFGHGLKIAGLPGLGGRIDPAALEQALARDDGAHLQPPAALSLTNATEFGAVYSADQVSTLTAMARGRGLRTHLDGARLANAIAAGFDPTAIKDLAIDILVVGGAKAGMSATEAIVLFDKSLSRRFDSRLKQAGQLPSKARYLAAPWIGMLTSGAWIARARHANEMARRLAGAIPFPLAHPVESNAVFVRMPQDARDRLRARGWVFFPYPGEMVRLMCSWATTQDLVDEFLSDLKQAT